MLLSYIHTCIYLLCEWEQTLSLGFLYQIQLNIFLLCPLLYYIPSFAVGVLYGITNVCVGHPFDTLKTKMQAQVGFEKTNMFQTFAKTLRTQGVVGLYR